jgi:hypothetical protein
MQTLKVYFILLLALMALGGEYIAYQNKPEDYLLSSGM